MDRETPVREIMTTDVLTFRPDDNVDLRAGEDDRGSFAQAMEVIGQRGEKLEVDRVRLAVGHPEHGHDPGLLGIDRVTHLFLKRYGGNCEPACV